MITKEEYFQFLETFELRQEGQGISETLLEDFLNKFESFGVCSFYKYARYNEEYILQILNDGIFHFSTFDELNDPSEFSNSGFTDDPNLWGVFDVSENETDVKKRLGEYINSNDYKNAYNLLKENTLVYSLTTKFDNNLMWAHYGDSFKGVCYEYDAREILNKSASKLAPVLYKDIAPMINVNDGIHDFLKSVRYAPYSKNITWNYEDEWRISKVMIDKNFSLLSETEKMKIANTEIVIKPKSVTLGTKMNVEVQRRIIDSCRNNNIKVYKLIQEGYNYSRSELS